MSVALLRILTDGPKESSQRGLTWSYYRTRPRRHMSLVPHVNSVKALLCLFYNNRCHLWRLLEKN